MFVFNSFVCHNVPWTPVAVPGGLEPGSTCRALGELRTYARGDGGRLVRVLIPADASVSYIGGVIRQPSPAPGHPSPTPFEVHWLTYEGQVCETYCPVGLSAGILA